MECLGEALGVDMWAVGSGQGELGRPGSCHEGPDYEVVDVAGRGWRTCEWCPRVREVAGRHMALWAL